MFQQTQVFLTGDSCNYRYRFSFCSWTFSVEESVDRFKEKLAKIEFNVGSHSQVQLTVDSDEMS
jgi:hypothetical protein